MEVSKHWRLKQQRYSLRGECCPHCDNKIFPPRDVCPNCGDETYIAVEVATQTQAFPVEPVTERVDEQKLSPAERQVPSVGVVYNTALSSAD